MDKVKSLVPMAAFVICLVRSLIKGFDLQEVLALLVLAALYAFIEYAVQYKKLSALENKVQELSDKSTELEKRNEEITNHISGLKMSNSLSRTNISRI